jgi:hypothetical protein
VKPREAVHIRLPLPIPVNQSTMAYNGAAPVPPAGVWVKIYYKGQEEVIGDAIEIKAIRENVNDLKIAAFPVNNEKRIPPPRKPRLRGGD